MKFPLHLHLIFLVKICFSYPDGAPEESYRACHTLIPGHGYKPQNDISEPPAKIYADKLYAAPGQTVRLNVISDPEKTFKGFIIQARRGDNLDSKIGSFQISDYASGIQVMDCTEGLKTGFNNSVTHTDRTEKKYVEALWIPPDNFGQDFVEKVVFKYSIVENFQTFWADLKSDFAISSLQQGTRKT